MNITDYPITTHFNEIDRVHPTPHSGIDIACPAGTKLFSEDSGLVSITCDKWLGITVRLKLDNGDEIVYGHLSKINIAQGQYVASNTLLGLTGGVPNTPNCGVTTAAHLHVSEYHNGQLIDPSDYLFHHQNQSNDFVFPVMLILLLVICWKMRKWLFFGLGIGLLLLIVFLLS